MTMEDNNNAIYIKLSKNFDEYEQVKVTANFDEYEQVLDKFRLRLSDLREVAEKLNRLKLDITIRFD